jgi:cysteine-rich repeat protein
MRNFLNAGWLGVVVLAAGLNACGSDTAGDDVVAGGGGSPSAGGQSNAGKGGSTAGGASGTGGSAAGKGGAGGSAAGKGGAGGSAAGKGGSGGTAGKGGAGGAGMGGKPQGGAGGMPQAGAGGMAPGGAAGTGGAGGPQGGAGQGGTGGATGGQNQGGAGSPQAGQNQGGAGMAQGGAGQSQGGAGQNQGGAGAEQGGAGQGGAGGPQGCLADNECDDKNPCTADSCVQGVCMNPPTNGPLEQTVGDCKVAVCDNGTQGSQVDTMDAPQADPNGCSIPSCSADGAPTSSPKANGTVCSIPGGNSGVCEDGVCGAGCTMDSECDDKNGCTTDACVAGKCTNPGLADGTPDPTVQDLPGDCKIALCQGGKSTTSPAVQDVPDDMNPCTTDTCDAAGSPHFDTVADGTACTVFSDICIKGTCQAPSCGDGIRSPNEACDGADLNGKDCTTFGYMTPGGLTCSGACVPDASGCKAKCGNGLVEPGEECDDAVTPGAPGGGCSIFCTKEPTVGQLIVTEILFNPEASSSGGEPDEWFEVYNTTDAPFDMRGLQLAGPGATELHIISSPTPLIIGPKTYVVFTQSADLTKNGGITPFYTYGSKIAFNNSEGDSIRIEVPTTPATLIDSAGYVKSTATKVAYKGASYSLNPTKLDTVSNDLDINYCPSKTDCGTPNAMTGIKDKGTPGAPNDPCP